MLATGLGKTWLAAFDHHQLREELGRRPRLLFVAHRRELLRQAAATWRRLGRVVDPGARVGWFGDEEGDLSADLVFTSVAKLARPEHLSRLRAERFDYVVIDEVHHAAADSYRRILAALDPRFLLGLTATPDRADAADILGLFDDHLAYRADVARGVDVGRLVPFRYFGLKDTIDYAPEQIPWRNRRFDPDTLARAAQTEARMQTLWRAWDEHPGRRTLVFCCSIAHALYVRGWLRAKGLRVDAVFSGEGSDDRDGALDALAAGRLDAVCAVDVFNEGVDVPTVDRVVMLRPTESGVVFAQQLGRGLRASEGKRAVTVVDFVGNHRVFLERARALLSLATNDVAVHLRRLIDTPAGVELPAGCSVELELEAKDLLRRMLAVGGADEVERAYRELRVGRGERPTAGELQRLGVQPGRLRDRHGSWFGFVRAEGDLAEDEVRAAEGAEGLLTEVETTEMTRCFKMVTLLALLEEDALTTGMPLRALALRAHAILRRSPELFADVAEAVRVDELGTEHEARWLAYWRRNPIEAWTATGTRRRKWFRVDGERLVFAGNVDPALRPALSRLTRELVDYRLTQYRARRRLGVVGAPPREAATHPSVTALRPHVAVVTYPDLRAAAGHATGGVEAPRADRVMLPVDGDSPGRFAVRVAGTSMDGGREPLQDGDWAVLRAARGATASTLLHRVVLAEVAAAGGGSRYHLKRLAVDGGCWRLTSDHPDGPTIEPYGEVAIVARLEQVIRPEDLAPPRLSTVPAADLAAYFGLDLIEPRSGRYGGHLFVFVDRKGVLVAPDAVEVVVPSVRPGETAFVLAKRPGGDWTYLGVARQVAADEPWRLEAVDHATWRAWGEGRGASRRLPDGALVAAKAVVAALAAMPEAERVLVQANGRRARVLGAATTGGLTIDGDDGGFAARTVSLLDLAWVVVADGDVRANGGVLDEERVNALRYLEGTPRGSTRWIDTGWALAAFARWRALERNGRTT